MSVALASPAAPSLRSQPASDPREARDNELLVRYHRQGDLDAREALAARFVPVARDLASRYRYTNEPLEDLVQVACLGLMKAIDRFEPGRGSRFMSGRRAHHGRRARATHFRDKGWALHVPRELQERVLNVNRASETLSKRLRRSLTPREIGAALHMPAEAVLEALEAGTAYDTSSLDSPLSVTEDESGTLIDTLGSEDGRYDFVEMSGPWPAPQGPASARAGEPRLRFVDDLTQREIGERVGVSQMHVSRLLAGPWTRSTRRQRPTSLARSGKGIPVRDNDRGRTVATNRKENPTLAAHVAEASGAEREIESTWRPTCCW